MKIIIAGAGEVGVHLAKLLSQNRNNDVALLDTDEERLNLLSGFEIMTIEGNPVSIADLRTAGVKSADMFVAVTPEETTNLTACLLANNLEAKTTIARVSNEEYIHPKNMEFFKQLGVDSLICPETLAAGEIVNAMKTPWSRQWFELADGKLIVVGAKIRENAPLVNKYLRDLTSDERIYHIVAIKRGDETIIPGGNDQILPNDIIFFTTTPRHINEIKTLSGKEKITIDRAMIMGGSRIALRVTEMLSDGINIKLLEKNREKCYQLAEKVGSNVMIVNGDASNTDLLISEDIANFDAFIALTENSETNILACVTAKSLGVRKTVAQVENIDYIRLAEKLDIGTVINKKLIAVSHIYQFLLNADVSTVKCMTFANAEVAELVARKNSKITKKPIRELNLPRDMTLGGRIRNNGQAEIIRGETMIEAGDHVVVFCLDTAMRRIEDYFN
ncbi:MAG: Trk system potassium transporter TrkA [Dysgonamonadaceae bacterium]|jgi:trk system potassium uptake protein TrkA|nr:Trk system potassium transporter TrkA [Dysgonamonadaceae bacterium]